MAVPSMFQADIVTSATIYIDDPFGLEGGYHVAEATIYVQHPDQRVAQKLGEALASDIKPQEMLDALGALFEDVKIAAGNQLDELTQVDDLLPNETEIGDDNGAPSPPVTTITTALLGSEGTGFVLIVTVPYNEDRYGDLYIFGIRVGPKPARTNACATCESENPQFRCSACKTDLYCGNACQEKAWANGHDTTCPCS